MSTHTEVILRALATYDNPAFGPGEVLRIINENQDSFQAGAPYPDAFYNTLCQEGNFNGRFMEVMNRCQNFCWFQNNLINNTDLTAGLVEFFFSALDNYHSAKKPPPTSVICTLRHNCSVH